MAAVQGASGFVDPWLVKSELSAVKSKVWPPFSFQPPAAAHTIMIPRRNPKSPTRFVMNAFFAASPAESFFQ